MKYIIKYIDTITFIGLVLIITSPFILSLKSFSAYLDFSSDSTGNIGSTIGGITAPFIGIITIILVYLTYNSQKDELEKQET